MPSSDHYHHLYSILEAIPDPRSARGIRHPLPDILFMITVATIANADDIEAVRDYVELNEAWFSQRCEMPHGIPSLDTFLRVINALNPEVFSQIFTRWVEHMWGEKRGKHVALDGKTLRRSFHKASGLEAIHSVGAFASESGIFLGQTKTNAKENEITAIPKLLELIDIEGAVVTIDAMGCQRAIAEKIVENGGDYILQVKATQPNLHENIADFFEDAAKASSSSSVEMEEHMDVDGDHGRVETRRCCISKDISWVENPEKWEQLQAIAMVERHREIKSTGKQSGEVSFFILSDGSFSAEEVNRLVRSHWSIENQVHWVLDVSWREDDSRLHTGHGAENLAIIRRLTLNLVRQAPNPAKYRHKKRISLKRRRYWASGDMQYMEEILGMRPVAEG